MSVQLNFITALPSEARPIIDRFKLGQPQRTNGITWYENADVRLAVSGVGKSASAFAVGVLSGMDRGSAQSLWLNVGIAGHRDASLGTIGIAHRIDDLATAQVHYPAIVFNAPCASFRVACFDRPTTSYHGDALCDMESAAFFAAAIRTSGVEFAHVLKIVSDNNAEHLDGFAARVTPAPVRESSDPILQRWRFSVTQALQLAELERRCSLLRPDSAWPPIDLTHCTDARAVLRHLADFIDSEPLRLEVP